MMKQLKITLLVFVGALVGFFVGFNQKKPCQKEVVAEKIQTETTNQEFEIKKGATYLKAFTMDAKDPFAKTTFDTIKVLELAASPKDQSTIYVKWTFTKWNDTTKYISSSSEYLSKDIKEIK